MAVLIGSARIDERGRISGGSAGDQTGSEVATQNWYLHSKGWRVLRSIDASQRRKIAAAMRAACKNDNIGYDQGQRNTLYSLAAKVDFDPSKVTAKCETDCSALVRVCCAYAGISVKDFITSNEAGVLLASGAFRELTGDKYAAQSAYLAEGDILVTKTKGHTVVVLSDGSKVEPDATASVVRLSDRILKNGMEGADVKELQQMLISLGSNLSVTGEYDDATEIAVRAFQQTHGCEVDGETGPETLAALDAALAAGAEEDPVNATRVEIFGGSAYVRAEPNTGGKILGVVRSGDALPYGGRQSTDGWNLVRYNDADGWVSGRYSRLAGAQYVRIANGNCNVRTEPSTSGRILGTAHAGDILPYLGRTSADGWMLVRYNGADGWVSGRYSALLAD